MLRRATSSAISSALEVAAVITCEAEAGSAYPISSIGLPTILVSRAARPGCSSKATALRNAARSPSLMPAKSNTACAPPSAGEPALYGGLVQGRGGDPAERTFRHFVNAEGKQPRGGDAKPYRPIGLLLNQLQGACKTLGFARIGIERGVQKKKPDHREHE